MTVEEIKKQICEVGQKLYDKGFVAVEQFVFAYHFQAKLRLEHPHQESQRQAQLLFFVFPHLQVVELCEEQVLHFEVQYYQIFDFLILNCIYVKLIVYE